MSILIRDEAAIHELVTANEPQELRSPDGRLLGKFIPADLEGDVFPEFGMKYSEMLREINDPATKWHTPDEVMARLREIDRCSP